jgi:hypothetical protein
MGVTLFTSQATTIGETNLATFPPGVYSVGEIMPPGLTIDQLQAYSGPRGNHLRAGGIGRRDSDSGDYIPGMRHTFVPVFGASPFPPLNDPDVHPPAVDRWATEALLIYDANSGELMLDTTGVNGGNIFSYSLHFTDAVVETEAFQSAGSQFPSVSSRQIVEAGLSYGGIAEGRYNLGSVLPVGLMEDEFLAIVNENRTKFVGEPGHTAAALNLDASGSPLALAYVPEPTTSAFFHPIALALIVSRRFWSRSREHR